MHGGNKELKKGLIEGINPSLTSQEKQAI